MRGGFEAWAHDAVYLAMSFVVWNWRKSRYQKSHCTIRCPCQSLSDSGRVGESRCEASYYLKDPRRFSLVCPALKPTAVGLRCHHTLAEVRPYWGRAFAAGFFVVVMLYAVAVSGWFGALRLRGYAEVHWTDCAWPPHWSEISIARSAKFQSEAEAAMARGEIPVAIRAFSQAVHADPTNWANALQLARLYEQVEQFAASEQLFLSLATRFPEHDQIIAAAHHDAMVASQRFESVQDLAWRHLLASPQPASDWFFVLLAATAASADPAAIWSLHPERCAALPPAHRALLGLVSPPPGTSLEQAAKFALALDLTDSTLAWLRIKFLMTSGRSDAAYGVLLRDLDVLTPFDAALARWITLPPNVPEAEAAADWLQLISLVETRTQLARLCAESLLAPWSLPWRALRPVAAAVDHRAQADIWAVAGLRGDHPLASELLVDLQIDPLNPAFQIDPRVVREHLPLILSRLSLSREVQYAIMTASRPVPAPRFAD